jgi:hypothetical protein
MRAINYPLRENITGSGDDLGWVKYAKGSAVPENQKDHSRYNIVGAEETDESCAMLQA